MAFTALTEVAEQIQTKKAEVEALYRKAGEPAIKSAVRELFEAHPKLTGIRWTQYTPYFNDGDPCVFGLGSVYYRTSETDPEGGDEGDGWEYAYGSDESAIGRDVAKFESALNGIEDSLELIFGDHVEVTCTRDGIEVDEYQHE